MGVYPVKQLIIIRKDLGMNKGKLAAQAAHASMASLLSSFKADEFGMELTYENFPDVEQWLTGSFAKIALAVSSEEELEACYKIAKENDLLSSYIVDNGTTVFNGVPTPTCVGVGPAQSAVLDSLFSHLKLY